MRTATIAAECVVCGIAGPRAGWPTADFTIGGVTQVLCQGCDESEDTPVRTFAHDGATYWFTAWDDVAAAGRAVMNGPERSGDRAAIVADVVARGACEPWVYDPDNYALTEQEAVDLLNADRARNGHGILTAANDDIRARCAAGSRRPREHHRMARGAGDIQVAIVELMANEPGRKWTATALTGLVYGTSAGTVQQRSVRRSLDGLIRRGRVVLVGREFSSDAKLYALAPEEIAPC